MTGASHDLLSRELATGGAALLLAALRAVWGRTSPLLGDDMNAAIFARVVDEGACAHSALRGLRVSRDGFSFDGTDEDALSSAAAPLLGELVATIDALLGAKIARAAASDVEAVARVHRVARRKVR